MGRSFLRPSFLSLVLQSFCRVDHHSVSSSLSNIFLVLETSLQKGKKIGQVKMMLSLLKCYIPRILRAVSSKEDVLCTCISTASLMCFNFFLFHLLHSFYFDKFVLFQGVLNLLWFFIFSRYSFCLSALFLPLLFGRIFRIQICNIHYYDLVSNFSLEAAHLLKRIDKSHFPNESCTKSLRICIAVVKI